MIKTTILAKELDKNGSITFNQNDYMYRIWISVSSEGWYCERYDMSDFWAGDALHLDDCGICTGSAQDAIEFLLKKETTIKEEEVEPYWNKKVKALEGKTIKTAKYITKERADQWEWYNRGLEIEFTDGTSMLLSQDDEGNGPGSAFTSIPGLEVIPVL